MLEAPFSSDQWQVLGKHATLKDIRHGYLTIVTLIADSWRRLYFKFRCCPWECFDIAPFHGKPSEEVDALIKTLLKRARKCSACVDLAFTFPLLLLLQDPAEKKGALDMLNDILVAMRPTSIAGERNHLVNQTNQHRGHLRDGLSMQVESLLGNIATEHRALRKAVDELVFGKGSGKTVARVRGGRTVAHSAPCGSLGRERLTPKRLPKKLSRILPERVSSAGRHQLTTRTLEG